MILLFLAVCNFMSTDFLLNAYLKMTYLGMFYYIVFINPAIEIV